MQIGNQFAEHKLYRGIKHYDGRPLMSEDLHEFSDTLYKKSSYFTNSLIGSGTLNEPPLVYSSEGVFLSSPSVILVDGDIVLVQTEQPLLKLQDIETTGITEGLLCIVGWYQSIDANSTLRSYGGVNNPTIENDLYNEEVGTQPTSRYQFRWDTLLIPEDTYRSSGNIEINIKNRESTGSPTSGETTVIATMSGDIRVATKPASMDYAVSDLYIIPILTYKYNGSVFEGTSPVKPLNIGGSEVIKSNAVPTGNVEDGTIWYNTDTKRFRVYVEGVGFVSPSPDVSFEYKSHTHTFSKDEGPANIPVSIGIDDYGSDDILQVVYEGLVLVEGEQYTVNSSNNSILLLDFTVVNGDKITFLVTKLINVDSGIINPVYPSDSPVLVDNVTGRSYTLEISDGVLDILEIADTSSVSTYSQRAVSNTSPILVDSVTGKSYTLVVSDGIFGISEV